MTYISRMAKTAEREANAMVEIAAALKRSASMFSEGIHASNMSMQVQAMLPLLGRENKTHHSFIQHYSLVGQFAGEPGDVFVLTERHNGKLKAINAAYLSPDELRFLSQLNAMKEGDELYRIFWTHAARDVAAMDVEDFSRGEFAHYQRCRAVMRRLWPLEDDTMPESWRPDWEGLKDRLKAA